MTGFARSLLGVVLVVGLGCNDLFDLHEAKPAPESSGGASGDAQSGGATTSGSSGGGTRDASSGGAAAHAGEDAGRGGSRSPSLSGGAPSGGVAGGDAGAGAVSGAGAAAGEDAGGAGAESGDGGAHEGGNAGSAQGGDAGDAGGASDNAAGNAATGGKPGVVGVPCGMEGPSCNGGLSCGDGKTSCCASLAVPGGDFQRGTPDSPSAAIVTAFCLDKYEVTVGRFRKFLAGYDEWYQAGHPHPYEGEHPIVGVGSGWSAEFRDALPHSAAEFKDAEHLMVEPSTATWSDSPGAAMEENRPINSINWYEAFAFCIWDGGRLPTEAEWEYAAGNGKERRRYPWGDEIHDDAASYACLGDGKSACSLSDILPVGHRPLGDGAFGHGDLAGNVAEWNLDYYKLYPSLCDNCALTTMPSESDAYRIVRGGGWNNAAEQLSLESRLSSGPINRFSLAGVRCARNPL